MEDTQKVTVIPPTGRQKVFAAAVTTATLAYLVLAMSGIIKPGNRLSVSELGVVVVAAATVAGALRPSWFGNVQRVDFAGIKIELGEVQKHQQQQQAVLGDVQLALRLLIGGNEQNHLKNLFQRQTNNYRVKGALRDEIRRLRGMRLIEMVGDRRVREMPSDAVFDLSHYVKLTDDGLRYVALLTGPDVLTKDAGAPS